MFTLGGCSHESLFRNHVTILTHTHPNFVANFVLISP